MDYELLTSKFNGHISCDFFSVGPISPPQPPSVSAWNKPLTSFGSATSSEVGADLVMAFVGLLWQFS